MWSHVSVPQSDRGPVEVQCEGSVVLPKPRDEVGWQGGGHLKILVSEEEWSNRGVQTEMSPNNSRSIQSPIPTEMSIDREIMFAQNIFTELLDSKLICRYVYDLLCKQPLIVCGTYRTCPFDFRRTTNPNGSEWNSMSYNGFLMPEAVCEGGGGKGTSYRGEDGSFSCVREKGTRTGES